MKRVRGIVAYVAFLLLIAEATLQIYYRATAGEWLWVRAAAPIYRADPASGVFNRSNLDYTHRTNEFVARYVTNSAGFRVPAPGREFARPKPPGVFRVVLVGASFAYGWGVDYEDSFAGRLEQRLRESHFAAGRKIELINVGVPSLPESGQLAWFEANGAAYQPDLVIALMYGSLGIPVGQAVLQVDADGYLRKPDATRAEELRGIAKKSGLVFYGWILSTRLAGDGAVAGAGRAQQQADAFDPRSPEVLHTLDHFEKLRAAVSESGARLVIPFFPLSYVVHPQDRPRWRHLGVTDVDAQIAFDASLCSLLISRGFECVNGSAELIEAAKRNPERLYYWLDIHWTARGNELAAKFVSDYLARDPRSSL